MSENLDNDCEFARELDLDLGSAWMRTKLFLELFEDALDALEDVLEAALRNDCEEPDRRELFEGGLGDLLVREDEGLDVLDVLMSEVSTTFTLYVAARSGCRNRS